jgi:hypothetical protein
MKKIFLKIWEFLIAWSEIMEAYRKRQGRNFKNYI